MANTFAVLRTDDKVQVGDKLRLDASKSFTSPIVAITKYEFDPTNSGTYIDNGTVSYLDWVYAAAATTTAKLRVTAGSVAIITLDIVVVNASDDRLFSDDAMLVEVNPVIMKYLPIERSSFKYVHRRAQTHILDSFDQQRVYKEDGSKITAADILDLSEVSNWATHLVLSYIMDGISNTPDDFFDKKSKEYLTKAHLYRHDALRYDFNKNGIIDQNEGADLFSGGILRR